MGHDVAGAFPSPFACPVASPHGATSAKQCPARPEVQRAWIGKKRGMDRIDDRMKAEHPNLATPRLNWAPNNVAIFRY